MFGLDIPTEKSASSDIQLTVRFVDLQSIDRIGRMVMFELVNLFLWRVPEAGVIDRGYVEILRNARDPSRQSVDTLS